MNNVVNQALGKSLVRLALATAALLLVPLLAMQFTEEVAWTFGDFAVAGILVFGAGLAFLLITRNSRSRAFRIGIGFTVAVIFFYIWAELAVGIFTNLGS